MLPKRRAPVPPALMAALVAAIVAAVFSPALNNGFVNWDDDLNFLNNPNYRGLDWRHLRWMFSTFHLSNYQPLSWLGAGWEYALWGLHPFGYHLTSILLHMLNAVLLYFVTARLLRLGSRALPKTDDAPSSIASAFAALLFALHPLRAESAAWLSAQHDLLAGAFYLLAVLCYLLAAEGLERRRLWLASSVLMFVCSLLSKINGITLPLALVLLDLYPLRRLGRRPRQWLGPRYRRVWLEKVPFLAAALAAGIVGVAARDRSGSLSSLAHYGVGLRIQQSFFGLAFYLGKTLAPVRLSPFYQIPADLRLPAATVLSSVGLVLGLSAALLYWRRRWPAGLAAWAYYIVTLLPVLGLVAFGAQIAADRYTYLPCLGWAIAAGAVLERLLRRNRMIVRAATLSLAAALLAILSGSTMRQIGVWKDSLSLWSAVLAVYPDSYFAHGALGAACKDKMLYPQAESELREAIRLAPYFSRPYLDLSVLYAETGRLEAAIPVALQRVRLHADSDAWNNLGVCYLQHGLRQKARQALEQASRLEPQSPQIRLNLGLCDLARGELGGAEQELRQAALEPATRASAWEALGELCEKRGLRSRAARYYQDSLRLNPLRLSTIRRLAALYASAGRREEAAGLYEPLLSKALSATRRRAGPEDDELLKFAKKTYLETLREKQSWKIGP